jgi:hypothetical protein
MLINHLIINFIYYLLLAQKSPACAIFSLIYLEIINIFGEFGEFMQPKELAISS